MESTPPRQTYIKIAVIQDLRLDNIHDKLRWWRNDNETFLRCIYYEVQLVFHSLKSSHTWNTDTNTHVHTCVQWHIWCLCVVCACVLSSSASDTLKLQLRLASTMLYTFGTVWFVYWEIRCSLVCRENLAWSFCTNSHCSAVLTFVTSQLIL